MYWANALQPKPRKVIFFFVISPSIGTNIRSHPASYIDWNISALHFSHFFIRYHRRVQIITVNSSGRGFVRGLVDLLFILFDALLYHLTNHPYPTNQCGQVCYRHYSQTTTFNIIIMHSLNCQLKTLFPWLCQRITYMYTQYRQSVENMIEAYIINELQLYIYVYLCIEATAHTKTTLVDPRSVVVDAIIPQLFLWQIRQVFVLTITLCWRLERARAFDERLENILVVGSKLFCIEGRW